MKFRLTGYYQIHTSRENTLMKRLWLSWRKWLDPIVDYGREVYIPWQLSQGQVLYRDIAYFNGPLSPYFNALVFKTFGVGLMSLAWVNIAILGGLTFLIHCDFQVDWRVGFGLNEEADDFFTGVGFAWRL